MKRIALVFAVATFAAAWAGGGGGMIGRWLTFIGLLVSERLAAIAMPRAARIAAKQPADGSLISVFPVR